MDMISTDEGRHENGGSDTNVVLQCVSIRTWFWRLQVASVYVYE